MSVLHSYPGKALWTLLAVTFNLIRFPLWLIYYLLPSMRPHRQWTFRQTIGVQIVKTFLWNCSVIEAKTPLSLLAKGEKRRWAVIQPANSSKYTGPVNVDPDIKPESIGATWYPAPPGKAVRYVAMHFHGGAYVIGDGRSQDAGFAAKTLIANTDISHVLAPQYRLSSNPGCQFPAALQDAITSYAYLLEQGISPNQIIFSGDSAGANLALALTRYLTEHGSSVDLPSPLCTLLWSPWVSPGRSMTTEAFDQSPNIATDYITGEFGKWGAMTYQPSKKSGLTIDDPYISFQNNAFATKTPIYISTGECEVLFHDDVELAEQMKAIPGNNITLQIEELCVHDTILVGAILGFEKEAARSAKRVGEYLRSIDVPSKL